MSKRKLSKNNRDSLSKKSNNSNEPTRRYVLNSKTRIVLTSSSIKNTLNQSKNKKHVSKSTTGMKSKKRRRSRNRRLRTSENSSERIEKPIRHRRRRRNRRRTKEGDRKSLTKIMSKSSSKHLAHTNKKQKAIRKMSSQVSPEHGVASSRKHKKPRRKGQRKKHKKTLFLEEQVKRDLWQVAICPMCFCQMKLIPIIESSSSHGNKTKRVTTNNSKRGNKNRNKKQEKSKSSNQNKSTAKESDSAQNPGNKSPSSDQQQLKTSQQSGIGEWFNRLVTRNSEEIKSTNLDESKALTKKYSSNRYISDGTDSFPKLTEKLEESKCFNVNENADNGLSIPSRKNSILFSHRKQKINWSTQATDAMIFIGLLLMALCDPMIN